METLRTAYEKREKAIDALKPIEKIRDDLHTWIGNYTYQPNGKMSVPEVIKAVETLDALREKEGLLKDQLAKATQTYIALLPKCPIHGTTHVVWKTGNGWDAECDRCNTESSYDDDGEDAGEDVGEDVGRREEEVRLGTKFDVAIQLADMDEPFLDPKLKKLASEWNSVCRSGNCERIVELQKKIEAML
jgi:hypothetical protein